MFVEFLSPRLLTIVFMLAEDPHTPISFGLDIDTSADPFYQPELRQVTYITTGIYC